MKNIKLNDKFEIEVKRFYVPLKITVNCPHCNEEKKIDLRDDYLSYPTLNEPEAIYQYCEHCENEFEFDATIRMSVDVDTKTRKL